jgi:hypothetical protein
VVKEGTFFTFKNPETKKPEATIRIPEYDVNMWVADRLKNTSNMIVAPSGCGKTVLSTLVLSNFIRHHRAKGENIAIILCAQTPCAYQSLMAANRIAQTPFLDENQLFYTSTLQPVIDIYWRLQQAYNAQALLPDESDTTASNEREIVKFKERQKEKINKLISNWKHFVFYFDDCNEYFKETVKPIKSFWNSLPTQHRHANITVWYNIQDIANIPSSMRTNISTLFVFGVIRQQHIFQKNFGHMFPAPYGNSPKKFGQFQTLIRNLVQSEHLIKTVFIYPAQDPAALQGTPTVYIYKVPQNFADALKNAIAQANLTRTTEAAAAATKRKAADDEDAAAVAEHRKKRSITKRQHRESCELTNCDV